MYNLDLDAVKTELQTVKTFTANKCLFIKKTIYKISTSERYIQFMCQGREFSKAMVVRLVNTLLNRQEV